MTQKTLLVSKVSGLCEGLTEEDVLGHTDHTGLDHVVEKFKRNRGKKCTNKVRVRRSASLQKKFKVTVK